MCSLNRLADVLWVSGIDFPKPGDETVRTNLPMKASVYSLAIGIHMQCNCCQGVGGGRKVLVSSVGHVIFSWWGGQLIPWYALQTRARSEYYDHYM